MKLRHFILFFLFIIIGYFIGQLVPYENLHPVIENKSITVNDYYTRIISIAGTVATLLAVIAALFKEDIRKWWDYAALEISLKDKENVICEILENENNESSSEGLNNLRATKYEISIIVRNIGRQPAKNCEIYLDKLYFKNSSYTSPQAIITTGTPLDWQGRKDSLILIPSLGKIQVLLVELFSPQSQSVSSEKNNSAASKPRLRIGNVDSPDEYLNGKWECIFIIYSENAKPIEYLIEIEWNGKWETRLTEMKNKNIKVTKTESRKPK